MCPAAERPRKTQNIHRLSHLSKVAEANHRLVFLSVDGSGLATMVKMVVGHVTNEKMTMTMQIDLALEMNTRKAS